MNLFTAVMYSLIRERTPSYFSKNNALAEHLQTLILFFNLHHKPVFVWIVAPVTSSTSSGDPFSSTSNFCNNIANAIVDSISANWSPTHFLGPPPKGKKAKSDIIWLQRQMQWQKHKFWKWIYSNKSEQNGTSFGYNAPRLLDGSKPAHPSIPWLSFCTRNLSGSNSLGLSQKYGDLWRLYTCLDVLKCQQNSSRYSQLLEKLTKVEVRNENWQTGKHQCQLEFHIHPCHHYSPLRSKIKSQPW